MAREHRPTKISEEIYLKEAVYRYYPLNLNIHFHILFLDGVYVLQERGSYAFGRSRLQLLKNCRNCSIA